MEIIFIRTAHHYAPYDDFFRLAELSGFAVQSINAMDIQDSEKVYILTPLNGEWMYGWDKPKARIIHWDLEWRTQEPYPQIPGVYQTWASDRWYADKVRAKFVPLGSHPRLAGYETRINGGPPLWVNQDTRDMSLAYDVALMMYRGPYRRARMIDMLGLQGLRIAPDAWNYDRHQLLGSSKAMVHIHQHDGVATIAPLRFALAAAYRLPLITETVKYCAPFSHMTILNSDYDNLARFTAEWVLRNDSVILQQYGDALYHLLCEELTFRKCVEGAL